MPISEQEWGQMREDIGFIRATVAPLADIPARVTVLEQRHADAVEDIEDIKTRRVKTFNRGLAVLATSGTVAAAVAALLPLVLH